MGGKGRSGVWRNPAQARKLEAKTHVPALHFSEALPSSHFVVALVRMRKRKLGCRLLPLFSFAYYIFIKCLPQAGLGLDWS